MSIGDKGSPWASLLLWGHTWQANKRIEIEKNNLNLLRPLPLTPSDVVGDQRAIGERANELLALKMPADRGELALGALVVLLLLLRAEVPQGEETRLKPNQKL